MTAHIFVGYTADENTGHVAVFSSVKKIAAYNSNYETQSSISIHKQLLNISISRIMKYIITQSPNISNKYNHEIHSLNDIYMSTKRENTNQGGVILCPLPQSPPEILRAVDGGVDGPAETPQRLVLIEPSI
jgi:hypothetical protein